MQWVWTVVALFTGIVFGMCLFAFLEVSREYEKEKGGSDENRERRGSSGWPVD